MKVWEIAKYAWALHALIINPEFWNAGGVHDDLVSIALTNQFSSLKDL